MAWSEKTKLKRQKGQKEETWAVKSPDRIFLAFLAFLASSRSLFLFFFLFNDQPGAQVLGSPFTAKESNIVSLDVSQTQARGLKASGPLEVERFSRPLHSSVVYSYGAFRSHSTPPGAWVFEGTSLFFLRLSSESRLSSFRL